MTRTSVPVTELPYRNQSWFKGESSSELHDKQLACIEWLLDPNPEKPNQKDWAAEHGVHEQTVRQWKKKKLFRDEWERQSAAIIGGVERIQAVVDALYHKATVDNDVKAMTAYLSYADRYAPTPTKQRELDLSDWSDEEVADALENVKHLRGTGAA